MQTELFLNLTGCFSSQDGGVDGVNDVCGLERSRRPDLSMTASRLDSEEVTVSQLLQSLRNETQRAEQLRAEMQSSAARYEQFTAECSALLSKCVASGDTASQAL